MPVLNVEAGRLERLLRGRHVGRRLLGGDQDAQARLQHHAGDRLASRVSQPACLKTRLERVLERRRLADRSARTREPDLAHRPLLGAERRQHRGALGVGDLPSSRRRGGRRGRRRCAGRGFPLRARRTPRARGARSTRRALHAWGASLARPRRSACQARAARSHGFGIRSRALTIAAPLSA